MGLGDVWAWIYNGLNILKIILIYQFINILQFLKTTQVYIRTNIKNSLYLYNKF